MTFLEDFVYKCFGCWRSHVLCHHCDIMVEKTMSFNYQGYYYCAECVPEAYFFGDRINLMKDHLCTGRYEK